MDVEDSGELRQALNTEFFENSDAVSISSELDPEDLDDIITDQPSNDDLSDAETETDDAQESIEEPIASTSSASASTTQFIYERNLIGKAEQVSKSRQEHIAR